MVRFKSVDYEPIVITFDGTSASGKGTLVRGLLKKLDDPRYKTMDAGAMYRAFTFYCMDNGIKPNDVQESPNEILTSLSLESLIEGGVVLNGRKIRDDKLRTPEIGGNVAKYADISDVKEFIVDVQRNFVDNYSGEFGLVLDGRCMGTAVAPNAQVKFFTDADVGKRAAWRHRDFTLAGKDDLSVDQVEVALIKRDQEDYDTLTHPLRKPDDAYKIITSSFSPKGGVEHVYEIVSNEIRGF